MSPVDILKCSLGDKIIPRGEALVQRVQWVGVGIGSIAG